MGKVNKAAACEQLALEVAAELGLTLWDTVYEKEGADWYLRYYVDKAGGVDIDDCEAFSRRISDILDEADPIEQSYCLEVSSPGIERVLRHPWHFRWALGRQVCLKLFHGVQGNKELVGTLTVYDAEKEIICVEDEAGNETKLPLKDVSRARLYYAFS